MLNVVVGSFKNAGNDTYGSALEIIHATRGVPETASDAQFHRIL
jgi:hypothetical protein